MGKIVLSIIILFGMIDLLHHFANSSKHIVLVTSPKSASDYIRDVLAESLDLVVLNMHTKDSENHWQQNYKLFFKTPRSISKSHINSRRFDTKEFLKYSDRVVVHVRDPRQVVLSMIHHIEKYPEGGPALSVPEDFKLWDISKRIDWSIEYKIIEYVSWIQEWLKVADNQREKPYILVTTYSEFLVNEDEFLRRISEFSGFKNSEYRYHPRNKELHPHFRKGDPEEWRKTFTKEQADKAESFLPEDLKIRFGWKR